MAHYLMKCEAWKSLSCIARAVYLDMASRYYGTNNGRIVYSIRCAVDELRIGNATAKRALDDLKDRGFIVATKRGAFSLKQRHASEWRLTEYQCDLSHNMPTKDFMRWTADKNKTRYPQRNRTDAVAEATGVCSGTSASLNTAHGVCSGTVKASLAA
jgi:DNA-binding transcriptional MocR family regulator